MASGGGSASSSAMLKRGGIVGDGLGSSSVAGGKLKGGSDDDVEDATGWVGSGEDCEVTAVAYWDPPRGAQRRGLKGSEAKEVSCCSKQNGESMDLARAIAAENLMLKQQVAELTSVVQKMKIEKKKIAKQHVSQLVARDRKEVAFLLFFAAIVMFALAAMWIGRIH